MAYILASPSSMLGDRLNEGKEYETLEILEGVGIRLTGTKKGTVIIPFTQVRGIFEIEDKKQPKKGK